MSRNIQILLIVILLIVITLAITGCNHVGIEPDIFEEINERAGG